MLTIRLSRIGKKNKPMYRLVISEKSKDPYGKALEILGSYNPYTKALQVKADRIKYWLSQGSGMSATVNNLLVENNIIKGEKVKASRVRKKKKSAKKEDKTTTKEKPAEQKKIKDAGSENQSDTPADKEKVKEKDTPEEEKPAGQKKDKDVNLKDKQDELGKGEEAKSQEPEATKQEKK